MYRMENWQGDVGCAKSSPYIVVVCGRTLHLFRRIWRSATDKNKSTAAGPTFEADIKKLADYLCKMQVLEEKLNKNENDIKVQEEYRKISEELINFTTKLEAKYGEEVLDSEKAKKIALEEWKKCPVKVIIN